MDGTTGGARSEAAHRAAAEPVADPGARSSPAMSFKRWATAKELSALAGIVVAAVGVLLGGTQWAVSSALETTLTFAVSPLREDLRLVQAEVRSVQVEVRSVQVEVRSVQAEVRSVQAEVRSVQAEVRSLSEGQAEIRGQLAAQGAEVSALREEMRAVQADVRSLSEGQADLRERLVRVETLLEPDGSSSDGARRPDRSGVPEQGGTESRPG